MVHFVSDSNPYVHHLVHFAPIVDNVDCRPLRSPMESFSETIRLMRVARAMLELSQDELAELAGVGRQTIVRIEAGGKGVAFDVVDKVRTALEKAGVVFLPSTAEHGPGVARRKSGNVT
ncbi:helix-turn-helix domain-containing protein [Mesorhizobium sp. VK24D]|uniref:Helix-turn-helix domain-containing protein n=1 Tax=Mesorhizobium album TaxID=3072314 RepID=A0ABU4Y4J0_9HYPH|nr:helix-turn-helix domain-containing protein [Mesorhizobium sp. VK24D]MDX8481861.1 helix-turn-helix domain-containing protein [Mesorhizobium sp. VK24D]